MSDKTAARHWAFAARMLDRTKQRPQQILTPTGTDRARAQPVPLIPGRQIQCFQNRSVAPEWDCTRAD
eukprot:4621518-Lingulodinium_polyedra.AAC.1